LIAVDFTRAQGEGNVPDFFWNAIPNFAFRVNVQAFVRSANYQSGTLKKLAQDIFDRYIRGKDFAPALQSYIDICWTIDIVKVATIGVQAPIGHSKM